MEEFMKKGEVVVLPFPFSDLSAAKKRPALIVATLAGNDVICCQITSEARFDAYALVLKNSDFHDGNLPQTSMIRPNRLFTAEKSIILYKVGALREKKVKEVEDVLIKMFTN